MGKRPSSWPVMAAFLLCSVCTLCISFPRYAEAAEGNDPTGVSPSLKAGLPRELKILHLENNINAIDLRGVGKSDDIVIKLRQNLGSDYLLIYLLLTKGNGDSSSELFPVLIFDIYRDQEVFYTFDNYNEDCVGAIVRLAHSPDKHTFMINVERSRQHGISPITLDLLQLVEDDGPDKPSDGRSKAYKFSLMESRDVKSEACTEDQMMKLAAKTFHFKLTR